jgi:hypothetical protein
MGPLLSISSILLSLSACIAFLAFDLTLPHLRVIALLALVLFGGATAIVFTARAINDRKVLRLIHLHAVKVVLVLVVLYAGWKPMLDPASPNFGYDPQRYYFDAEELRESGFAIEKTSIKNINYTGLLYFYAAVFQVFGFNAAAPALVNTFLTLLATLVLLRAAYRVKRVRSPGDWLLGTAFLIPEVVWYDAITSRESLLMVCYTVAVIGLARVFVDKAGHRALMTWVAVAMLVVIGIVRTPILFPAIGTLLILYISRRMSIKKRVAGLIIVSICVVVLLVSRPMLERFGAYGFIYKYQLDYAARANDALTDPAYDWSSRSIGRMLVPASISSMIALAPLRILAYVVAPLPSLHFSLSGLRAGDWSDWQSLAATASAFLYVLLIPLIFASTYDILRSRAPRGSAVITMAFWAALATAAVGNVIIQERYRVLCVLFLAGAAWLGRGARGTTVVAACMVWSAFLGMGAVAFVIVKLLA